MARIELGCGGRSRAESSVGISEPGPSIRVGARQAIGKLKPASGFAYPTGSDETGGLRRNSSKSLSPPTSRCHLHPAFGGRNSHMFRDPPIGGNGNPTSLTRRPAFLPTYCLLPSIWRRLLSAWLSSGPARGHFFMNRMHRRTRELSRTTRPPKQCQGGERK